VRIERDGVRWCEAGSINGAGAKARDGGQGSLERRGRLTLQSWCASPAVMLPLPSPKRHWKSTPAQEARVEQAVRGKLTLTRTAKQ
jgi:hypothetical protein